MKNKFKYLFVFLSAIFTSLISFGTVFADLASPNSFSYSLSYSLHQCINGSINCDPKQLVFLFVFTILFYLIVTLILEVPVFILFGFRKRALWLAVLANIISVILYQTMNAILGGTLTISRGHGWQVAELLIILFESIFLILMLRKEIKIWKIITGTIIANIISIVLGILATFMISGLIDHYNPKSFTNGIMIPGIPVQKDYHSFENGIPCIPSSGNLCP